MTCEWGGSGKEAVGALERATEGTTWLLAPNDRLPLGGCFPLGDTGAGKGVMVEKKSASCCEDGMSDSVTLLDPVLTSLLELRLTVFAVEFVGLVSSKLVPRTKGAEAGEGVGVGEVANGDEECVLLKLTFREFSVNWIDCLLWLLVRTVKVGGGVEGPGVGGATGLGLDSLLSDTDLCLVESTVNDCAC